MKYLKEFQGDVQYKAYTASTEFVVPNVSHCVQDGLIMQVEFRQCLKSLIFLKSNQKWLLFFYFDKIFI